VLDTAKAKTSLREGGGSKVHEEERGCHLKKNFHVEEKRCKSRRRKWEKFPLLARKGERVRRLSVKEKKGESVSFMVIKRRILHRKEVAVMSMGKKGEGWPFAREFSSFSLYGKFFSFVGR